MEHAILAIGLLIFASGLFTAAFERTRLPDVLPLMILGLLLGPVFGLVDVADFGKSGSVLSVIALVVILFEGGASTHLAALAASAKPTMRLTLVTFAVTMALATAAGLWELQLRLPLALALGAILGGTSSAVVVPMLRVLPLHDITRSTLFLESAITDVLTVVLTFGLIGAATTGGIDAGRVAGSILAAFLVALLMGVAGAVLFLRLVDWVRQMASPMYTMLAYVFVVYGVIESLGFSGAIGCLALGFTLANYEALGMGRLVPLKPVGAEASKRAYEFLADIIFLLKTFFFVYLGISIRFGSWRTIAMAAGLIVAIYLARLLIVRMVVSRRATRDDAAIMAVMVPKGLAAAVLASVPVQLGLPEGPAMEQFVYMVVLLSVVATSLLVPGLQLGPLRQLYGGVLQPFPPVDHAAADAGQLPAAKTAADS